MTVPARDPALPEAAVCDNHQETLATRLVSAPDRSGDAYLCEQCFGEYRDGHPLPFVRHSPSIRRRPLTPPRRRRSPTRSARPGAGGVTEVPAGLRRALAEFASESVVLVDPRGVIEAALGPAGGVLGHTERSGILQYVHPDDLSFVYSRLAEIEEPGAEVSFEIRARHRDGSYRRLGVRACNRQADPALAGLVIVSRLLED